MNNIVQSFLWFHFSFSETIQKKATKQYIPVVMFTILVGERKHKVWPCNKNCWALLSIGPAVCACFCLIIWHVIQHCYFCMAQRCSSFSNIESQTGNHTKMKNAPSMLRRNFLVMVPKTLDATHLYVPESADVTCLTSSLQWSGSCVISKWESDMMGSSSLNQAIVGFGRRLVWTTMVTLSPCEPSKGTWCQINFKVVIK